MNVQEIMKLPMGENDAKANTIGEYLIQLLATLWDEQDGFSGKRPFGNSGWEYDLYVPLVKANIISGDIDEEYGDILSLDEKAGHKIIADLIQSLMPR